MSTHHTRPINERSNIFFPDHNLSTQQTSIKPTEAGPQNRDKFISNFQQNLISKASNTQSTSNEICIPSSQGAAQSSLNQKDFDNLFLKLIHSVNSEKPEIKTEKEKLASAMKDIYKSKVDQQSQVPSISTINPIFAKSEAKPAQPGKKNLI
jgi:hypothetical protein